MSEKRITRGLLALNEARGEEGPSRICGRLHDVGGVYSQTSISLWLNGRRIPSGNARTHIRMAYGVPEALWAQAVANDSDGDAESEAS